jgi:hypothetical protein
MMMIDDFTDVNEGEKELMKMWNLHVMKHGWEKVFFIFLFFSCLYCTLVWFGLRYSVTSHAAWYHLENFCSSPQFTCFVLHFKWPLFSYDNIIMHREHLSFQCVKIWKANNSCLTCISCCLMLFCCISTEVPCSYIRVNTVFLKKKK